MLLRIRLFKYLDFKTFCFVVIYIIVPKNLFIYIIVLGAGRGWVKVVFPAPWGWGGDEDSILRLRPASLPSLPKNTH